MLMFIMMLTYQLMNEQRKAYRDAERTFLQTEQVLTENQAELIKIKDEYTQRCFHAAETVSRIIDRDPDALDSLDELKEIAAEVEVDEIHIFDREGKIFSGTEPQYYGYTMDSGEQMSFFKPMLEDKSLMLVQDITENTAETKLMQYSAVWSDSGEFIVQIGMNPVNVLKVTEKNELSYIFSLFRVNPNVSYYAIDIESGLIAGSNRLEFVGNACSDVGFRFEDIENSPKGFYGKINGQYSFCFFQKIGSNYIGRVIAVDYLYESLPSSMLLTLVCLFIISFILVISVTRYMNKYVVEKIQDVIQKLKSIAEGNLEERVDARDSLEFQELSRYINQMVQSLLTMNEMEQMVNETLRTALRAKKKEKSLRVVLESSGRVLNGERAYIFEKNRLGGDDNTYEWVAEGVAPEKDHLQNLPPEICGVWYRQFHENKNMVFENIEDMKEEDPLQYENLKKQNIVSIAVVPLYDDAKVIGFYGVDNPPVNTLLSWQWALSGKATAQRSCNLSWLRRRR